MEVEFGLTTVSCENADCSGCEWEHNDYDGKVWVNGVRSPYWFVRLAMRFHNWRHH
jgi:hypothetical protein